MGRPSDVVDEICDPLPVTVARPTDPLSYPMAMYDAVTDPPLSMVSRPTPPEYTPREIAPVDEEILLPLPETVAGVVAA